MYEPTRIPTRPPTDSAPGFRKYMHSPVIMPAIKKIVAISDRTWREGLTSCRRFLSAP